MHYEHPPITFLLIGTAQEADLVSPGFEQSTAISNRSTLDFTLLYGEQRIVLPGDASWKRLCSSSMPPDDDDDDVTQQLYKGSPLDSRTSQPYPQCLRPRAGAGVVGIDPLRFLVGCRKR